MTKAEEKGSIPALNKVSKCLVVGDSSVRNVGLGHEGGVFPGNKNGAVTQSARKE